MQAVLYISHGSRSNKGVHEAIHFISQCRQQINVSIQEICFLELVSPTIAEGIENCIKRGATRIAVVPVLLLTAVHAKKDIPIVLKNAKRKYPQLEFSYGTPFGIHNKLIECLYDQLLKEDKNISKESCILLVGRGSSDPDVKRDLTVIASRFEEAYNLPKVQTCFLYGANPKFDETLKMVIQNEKKQIYILPYLLFSGLLMAGIKTKIKEENDGAEQITLCESLGHHSAVPQILAERIEEMLHCRERQWVI